MSSPILPPGRRDEVFKVCKTRGEPVGVILMDTQEAAIPMDSTMLAFSVLNSSVQIYSLVHDFKENDIYHMQLLTKYGLLTARNDATRDLKEKRPFQNLVFLMHDWQFIQDLPFKWEDGDKPLQRYLDTSESDGEIRSWRSDIRGCFEGVYWFQMQNPDILSDVVTCPGASTSCTSDPDLTAAGAAQLHDFMGAVLSPETLPIKKINGREITFRDFCLYMQNYAKIISRIEVPSSRNLFEATVETNNYSL